MFKKLKEKITEEVKISPQRFVEFTQSVSDRLQNSSTSDDNFFSIGDDDTNSSVDNSYGFSSVQLVSPSQDRNRKNSTSSLASDVSFLPKYEPGSMYHLQSDLEISASEVEDNASTSSSQIGHLSKEQIYAAFQKSQMRYHKYRGRYTDLTRHYKDLERENVKMKGVLVETQDKAIRRVTELKEQCSLEQKAKAHLEGALRDEIDEKNYKIKTLQTQIGLLQNDNSSKTPLNVEDNANSSSENLENLTKYLNESRKEIENLNAKIQELKANVIVYQSKEKEYKSKILNLEKEIVQFSDREKENNLNLAQNKMDLHNEILIKDTEIANLKRETENLKLKLESSEVDGKSNNNQKIENLQSQNIKLIEKVESLTQKSNSLDNDLIKMETYKIEVNNWKQKHENLEKELIELRTQNAELLNANLELSDTLDKEKQNFEAQISKLREDAKKGLLSLEPKIREKLQHEFSAKEEDLRKDFMNKIEELTSNNTTTKTQLQIFEKDGIIKEITEQLNETNAELSNKINAYTQLEKDHLELIEDCTKLRDTVSILEKEMQTLALHDEKVSRLETHISTLQEELKTSEKNYYETEQELHRVLQEKKSNEKVTDSFEINLKKIEEEKLDILNKYESEKQSLTNTVNDLEKQIVQLKENLDAEKEKSAIINQEQRTLETQLDEMEETIRLYQLKENVMSVEKHESALLKLKMKELEKALQDNLESVEEEHQSISRDLDAIKKELNLAEAESSDEFSQRSLKSKLVALKEMCSNKDKEYHDLVSKQSNIEQESLSKDAQVTTLQSEISNFQSTTNDFQIKIQNLEESINESNSLLKQRETEINNITENSNENQNRIFELENLLSAEKDTCSKYVSEKNQLESKLQELEEKCKIMKMKEQGLQLEKNEYNITQLKLQKLEEEHQKLQQLYEEEKASFEKMLIENKKDIAILEKDKQQLSDYYENEKNSVEAKNKELHEISEDIMKIQEEKRNEVNKITALNKKLQTEIEGKEDEISKLSANISNLRSTIEKQNVEFNNLLSKTQQLDQIIENMRTENVKARQVESNDLNSKIELLKTELNQKLEEINNLNMNIVQLSNEKSEEHGKYEEKLEEITNLEHKLKCGNDDLAAKDKEIYTLNLERDGLLGEITTLRAELEDLTNRISQKVNTNLIYTESEKEILRIEQAKLKEEITELNIRIQQLSLDNRNILEENQSLSQEKEELKIALEILNEESFNGADNKNLDTINETLCQTIDDLKNQIRDLQEENSKIKYSNKKSTVNDTEITKIQQDFYEIKEKCDNLFVENKNLKLEYSGLEEKCKNFGKIKEKLETQINDLERHYNELLREKQLLVDEVQELKTAPVNYKNDTSRLDNLETLKKEQSILKDSEKQLYLKEMESLREKLTKYKSLDLTNKSSIEFYENELQKMKNHNDKLNRKLDETLVTLNHCTELSSSTEVEYLKNVLYNYMLGKESLILARVIAAVCKFDPQQTELILQKEQQKQTLLGQLGLI